MTEKKSAFVAVIGRPSAGKSSLVNLLCGARVSIVSKVPQTTRNAIRGILNRDQGQLVFIDTPGRHFSDKKFNKKLLEVSERSLNDADIVLYLLDASREAGIEEKSITDKLKDFADRMVIAINKIDLPKTEDSCAAEFAAEHFPSLPASRIVKISCLTEEGIDALVSVLFNLAPLGEAFYPDDYYTDQEISFRITEIIREKAMNRLEEELPHSIYVEAADVELKNEQTLWVRAFIVTERESQKGIVIGRGGNMIKSIRKSAEKELKKIFDWKIDLDLRVKTAKDWRQNEKLLRRLIN